MKRIDQFQFANLISTIEEKKEKSFIILEKQSHFLISFQGTFWISSLKRERRENCPIRWLIFKNNLRKKVIKFVKIIILLLIY